uniref:Uncharacterized protein n=1 Tax=Rhizophora mucronata TaxID=61149 RepID=A0A2P2P2E0_RHIMU
MVLQFLVSLGFNFFLKRFKGRSAWFVCIVIHSHIHVFLKSVFIAYSCMLYADIIVFVKSCEKKSIPWSNLVGDTSSLPFCWCVNNKV